MVSKNNGMTATKSSKFNGSLKKGGSRSRLSSSYVKYNGDTAQRTTNSPVNIIVKNSSPNAKASNEGVPGLCTGFVQNVSTA